MSLFQRRRAPDKAATEGTPGVRALEERIASLESKLERIDYEWSDWYDKFRRLHARIARRQQREETATAEVPTNGADLGDPNDTPVTNPMALRLLNWGK